MIPCSAQTQAPGMFPNHKNPQETDAAADSNSKTLSRGQTGNVMPIYSYHIILVLVLLPSNDPQQKDTAAALFVLFCR